LAEWTRHARIDFKGFWLRRARRLFPALFALLAVVIAYAVVFLPTEVAGLRGDALSTAAYMNNWYQVFSHKSYFESVGRPSLLRHMWSLAVEEQFYLCWPVLFSLMICRRRLALTIVLTGALASTLAMAALYRPDTDPSRFYYGTDTRAAGLLLGAALAFVWLPGQGDRRISGSVLDAAGLAAMGTLIACFLLINEFQSFLYRGGFTLVDLMTAELIAVAVHPQARLVPRALAWAPLRWVGLRSYGIYLWHFPVFMVTRPQLDVPLDGLPLLVARFVLTMGLAALSYRFLETPIRNGALGRSWKAWRAAEGRERGSLGLRWAAVSASIVAVFSILGVFLLTAQSPAPPAYLARASDSMVSAGAPANPGINSPPATKQVVASATPLLAGMTAPMSTGAPPATTRPPKIGAANRAGVTGIGDSVMEGVVDELKQVLGTNVLVDADQGRLPWNTPAIVRNLHANGKIQGNVIIHIGNNGFFSTQVFSEIMAELKEARRVVIVNVKAPRRWESLNNSMLASAVKSHPNAVLVDWYHASGDRPKIFWKDGIHLRPEGAKVYANLIAQAVNAP
jgi:peptidoglycan/LPS O-acetylase OafA/YrhL/lysophospholipase L1-like esterase